MKYADVRVGELYTTRINGGRGIVVVMREHTTHDGRKVFIVTRPAVGTGKAGVEMQRSAAELRVMTPKAPHPPTPESPSVAVEGGRRAAEAERKRIVAEQLLTIARDYLRLDTLDTRDDDTLDFRPHSVWSVRAALEAAYEAGRRAGG
jgi:hypothetical protein